MNREILFRGKHLDRNEWVFGNLVQTEKETLIIKVGGNYFQPNGVFPSSVGQYTGQKDKNGNKIFEGDIVRFSYITDGIKPIEIECLAKVVFEDGSFMIKCVKGHVHNSMQRALFAMDYFNIKVEVIGNVTDNPELLK